MAQKIMLVITGMEKNLDKKRPFRQEICALGVVMPAAEEMAEAILHRVEEGTFLELQVKNKNGKFYSEWKKPGKAANLSNEALIAALTEGALNEPGEEGHEKKEKKAKKSKDKGSAKTE